MINKVLLWQSCNMYNGKCMKYINVDLDGYTDEGIMMVWICVEECWIGLKII